MTEAYPMSISRRRWPIFLPFAFVVALAALGKADRAQKLYELNQEELTPKVSLPAGAQIKVPQRILPALAAFGLLVLFLLAVGLGWLFKTEPMHSEESADRSALPE